MPKPQSLDGTARDLHELHVDLDAFARFRFLKEFHLPRYPLGGTPQARGLEISTGSLDPAGDLASLPSKVHNPRRYPPAAVPRIPGNA